jgi:hypothetical protein
MAGPDQTPSLKLPSKALGIRGIIGYIDLVFFFVGVSSALVSCEVLARPVRASPLVSSLRYCAACLAVAGIFGGVPLQH